MGRDRGPGWVGRGAGGGWKGMGWEGRDGWKGGKEGLETGGGRGVGKGLEKGGGVTHRDVLYSRSFNFYGVLFLIATLADRSLFKSMEPPL